VKAAFWVLVWHLAIPNTHPLRFATRPVRTFETPAECEKWALAMMVSPGEPGPINRPYVLTCDKVLP
jgi:hypothetical protein